VLRGFRSWVEEKRAEVFAGRSALARAGGVRGPRGRGLGPSGVEGERLAAF